MDLSQNKLKYLVSLHQKKFRDEHQIFLAEGVKVINDLIRFGFIPTMIAYNPEKHELGDFGQTHAFCEYYTTHAEQDKKISLLATSPGVVAVFPIPVHKFTLNPDEQPFVFLLDNIQDPGNMGTIIRTAHWFGIEHLYLSPGCVEVYNPKVVQSSMGSLAAIKTHVINNEDFFDLLEHTTVKVYSTDVKGTPLTEVRDHEKICLVLGSESHGVSDYWRQKAAQSIVVPASGQINHPDSLNVAVSAAIMMHWFNRK